MILKVLLTILSTIFGFIGGVIFPNMPLQFPTIWNFIVNYVQMGVNFVATVTDFTYIRNLFGWWLSVMVILLAIEIALGLWRLATGNGKMKASDQ